MKTFISIIVAIVFVFSSCNSHQKKAESDSVSLFLVFNSNNNENNHFWKDYENSVLTYTKDLYKSGKITYVLPFSHPPLQHPDSDKVWTNAIIIGLNANEDNIATAKEIIKHIQNSTVSSDFKAADIMHLQKGLDMFYPLKNGLQQESKMNQIVEYVFSDPKARKEYYEEQYLFSGPAMREFHNNNMAGRFIGYEVQSRLFGDGFPTWDLIHVVGFTKEQSEKATPVFKTIFSKHAERAFGKGMTLEKKMKEWDTIRINVKSNAKQNMNITLPLNLKK